MCESFATSEPFYPHSNNDNTTTTQPMTTTMTAPYEAAPRQVVTPTCSNTPARCTSTIPDATIPSPDDPPTLQTTPTTTMIPADDDDDTTMTTMATPGITVIATIADDNDATTTTPHDSTTHPHPNPDPDHPQTLYAHPSPRLSDSYYLVHQALDRLENVIADMSNAVADLSTRIETALFTPPMPPRRFTLPSTEKQQPTSQPLSTGTLPNHRQFIRFPPPAPKPLFTNKTKLVNMRNQPHPSPSFRAMLLRMAKHNYRPP